MCPSNRRHRGDASTSVARRGPLRPAFDVLDVDCDGKISRDDLKAFFSSPAVAAPLSDEDIASMISAVDADRDGLVEFEEFESVLGRCGAGAGAYGVMMEAFRVMDRDGDGKVGFEDLKEYLEMARLPAREEDVWGMIRIGGGGGDAISFDGLLQILAIDFSS